MFKKLILLVLLLVLVPTVAFAQDTYTVVKGDSLWKISVKHQIGLDEIIAANPQVSNPDLIYPNQKINIPDISAVKEFEKQVVDLTNRERARYGLPPLKHNWELARVARHKSQDMQQKRYFSHNSPTYGSPFNMLDAYLIDYNSAGENIAQGQRTPQEVVNGWMNSSGHRENILNRAYTEIGVGYVEQGNYWTQLFIGK